MSVVRNTDVKRSSHVWLSDSLLCALVTRIRIKRTTVCSCCTSAAWLEMESSTIWNDVNVDAGIISSNNTSSLVGAHFVFVNPANDASRVVILVTYLLTFAVGVIGNTLVLYIIITHRQLRSKSVANYYIGNLALADISFVATLPLFCWTTYTSDWPFGDVACKLAYSVHDGVRLVGVFTLVALSVDRYVASYYDLGRCRTTAVGRAVCAGIWLSFAVMTLPYWLYASTEHRPSGTGLRRCTVNWPDMDQTYPGRHASSKLTWIRVRTMSFTSRYFEHSLHVLIAARTDRPDWLVFQ